MSGPHLSEAYLHGSGTPAHQLSKCRPGPWLCLEGDGKVEVGRDRRPRSSRQNLLFLL